MRFLMQIKNLKINTPTIQTMNLRGNNGNRELGTIKPNRCMGGEFIKASKHYWPGPKY